MSSSSMRLSPRYARFLARNFRESLSLPLVKPSRVEQHLVFGVSRRQHSERTIILRCIEASPAVSLSSSILYNCIGSRMIFATSAPIEKTGKVTLTGINIYYFNDFDSRNGIHAIHEAFIGVLPSHRGRAIATALRQAAFNHFKSSIYSGITTRIKKNNRASLSSALKIGFSITQDFAKYQLIDDEVYLFRSFEPSS
jgi:hypothetical protein